MKKKTDKIYLETTTVDPIKTAYEIRTVLVQAGARHISEEYDASREIIGMRFTLEVMPGLIVPFVMPVRIEPVFKLINGRRKSSYDRSSFASRDRANARRIAWRQLYRWVQVQLAMIQTGMAEAGQVFMAYAEQRPGVTLFEVFKEYQGRLLAAPEPIIHTGSTSTMTAEFLP